MDNIAIRAVTDQDLGAVAELRWQWALGRGHTPATSQEEFRDLFVRWAKANAPSHHCIVVTVVT